MEWVETTGKTVEEAKDAALDQLGVDEQDAEFEVVEEPKTGLFGRTRGEARVRARVRPTQPRPKVERRDRRGQVRRLVRASRGSGDAATGAGTPAGAAPKARDGRAGPPRPWHRRRQPATPATTAARRKAEAAIARRRSRGSGRNGAAAGTPRTRTTSRRAAT